MLEKEGNFKPYLCYRNCGLSNSITLDDAIFFVKSNKIHLLSVAIETDHTVELNA